MGEYLSERRGYMVVVPVVVIRVDLVQKVHSNLRLEAWRLSGHRPYIVRRYQLDTCVIHDNAQEGT